MKIFMSIIFLVFIGYHVYRLIQVLIKMKQDVILPITDEEFASIRTSQRKELNLPTYSAQKAGIIIYSLILLFLIITFGNATLSSEFDLSLYPLLFIPLLHSYDFFDLFVVRDDGILRGTSFVAWDKIKSFEFVRIDINHKNYGYSQEVNDKYELRIKSKFCTIRCIVMTDEMKERLTRVLEEQVSSNERIVLKN
ncbi:hypothetical protein SAMN04487943_103269 [Gracilibacillus orientalis]|uniref:DUF5673 domain-containing protein n=1 Tax=Gracilibacillus orientalis TaxID=334253 RepID=A0A1I4JZH7_9BACI|nr:hypothetical protein [Gracilibacillus orientalis]SFL71912.1 hypothetical protein SAMN04487943_103269 [Gracilibacillus orientalis]